MKRENKNLLVVTHLSQLLDVVTGFGGFIVPLVLWLANKNEVEGMDENGKSILNFRISMFIYLMISIPMVLLFGLGLLGILAVSLSYLIFPIVNAVRVSNGDAPKYPLSLPIL
jgi:uncharacterized Tic20 family protein